MDMFKIKATGVGHGLGYNTYPVEVEFSINGKPSDYDDEDGFYSIGARVLRKLKDKSACDHVSNINYEITVN